MRGDHGEIPTPNQPDTPLILYDLHDMLNNTRPKSKRRDESKELKNSTNSSLRYTVANAALRGSRESNSV